MCLQGKKFLVIILALGLALRLIFISLLPAKKLFLAGPLADQKEYVAMANNALEGKGIILGQGREIPRMPLYALFLAGSFRLFGENFLFLRLWQALFSLGSVGLVFLLTRRIFSKEAALLTALVAAIYPFFIFYTGLILNETLFIFFFLVEVYLLVRLGEAMQPGGKGARWSGSPYGLALAAGICAGVTVLLRGAVLLFYFFIWPFLFLMLRRKCKDRPPGLPVRVNQKARSYIAMVIFLVIFASSLLPWVWRNYKITGHFVPTTLRVGLSLYEGNSPQATGGPILHILKIPDEARDLSEYEKDKFFRQEARRYIIKHPGRFLRLAAAKFIRFWNPVPNYPGFRHPILIIGSVASFLPVLFLALLGIWLKRRDWRGWLLVILPVVYFALLHMVFVGSLRYRVPLMPFMMVLAGASAWQIIQGLHRK